MSKKTLGVWFQNKLKSKFTFGKSVATLNEGEDHKDGNNSTRPVRVDLRTREKNQLTQCPA